jgi:hypothetical protein
MSTTPELVMPRWVELAEAIPGIAIALDYEPGAEGLPALPCTTMIGRGGRRTNQSTGNVEEITWVWDILLYVSMSGSETWGTAQARLHQLTPLLLAAVRADYQLGGSCEWARLIDPSERPKFDIANGWLSKRFELNCIQDEH